MKDFAVEHYQLQGAPIVRPFCPGADYKSADYPSDCVVIDNPPFSILSEICAWYEEHGVRYFLFAPGLTLFSINAGRSRYLPVGHQIMYHNGAGIPTSFVTNLGSLRIELCPELYAKLEQIDEENRKAKHADLPVYSYPDHVATVTLNRLCKYGQAMQIPDGEASFVRALDAQREAGKAIYGGGFLLSEKAAAEKAAATRWPLSDRERAIIAAMGAEAAP